jgi:ribosomal protein L9
MHIVGLLPLFAFIAQLHCKDLVANHPTDSHTSVENVADGLIDKLLERALKTRSLSSVDIDKTVLEKPANAAVPRGPSAMQAPLRIATWIPSPQVRTWTISRIGRPMHSRLAAAAGSEETQTPTKKKKKRGGKVNDDEFSGLKSGYANYLRAAGKNAVPLDAKGRKALKGVVREQQLSIREQHKKESQALAKRLKAETFTIKDLKLDSKGHLYKSVGASEIVKLLAENILVQLDKKSVTIPAPFKEPGEYEVTLQLKENVPASFKLIIKGEIIPEVDKKDKKKKKNTA